MSSIRNVPRYLYLSSSIKNYIEGNNKVKFWLHDDEPELYCKSFVKELSDDLKTSSRYPKLLHHSLSIIPGEKYSDYQVRIIVELPEFGSRDWLLKKGLSCWYSNAIAGDVIFAEIYEAFSMDYAFLDKAWSGNVRGRHVIR